MTMKARRTQTARRAGAAVALGLAAGLAFAQAEAPGEAPPRNRDPLESFNRGVYRFNDGVDRAVLRPVATAYQDVVPQFARTGVTNFFNNLGDVWNLANNVLQFKLQGSAETFMRLNVNTVFGLGGLLDIASEAGIERHNEDFGQTLGYWGVPSGPFLMLPLLGPSTVRDTAALPVDFQGDALGHVHDIPARNSLSALRVVERRAGLLRATRLLDDAALDPYAFMRDAYLQRRLSEVHDGQIPGDEE